MIKSIKLFLLLLIAPTILELNSQALPKDFTQIDQNILNKHIIEEVNILRKRKKRPPLKNDFKLHKAAQDHAQYLSKKNTLTHFQNIKKKKTPADRLSFYKIDFVSCGENVQYIQPKYPFKLKKEKSAIPFNTYERLAKVLVTNWRHSKPHLKNMLSNVFSRCWTSTFYSKDKENFYAVQVFAKYEH